MKKENISIETIKDEFNDQKKDKIEKEKENINKKFEGAIKDINNYFILRHEE